MEKVLKDILNWKICDIFELSLKDVFALAHTCKTLYENTRPYLDNIRAMFEKWTPRRCLLELKRATNISDTQKRKIQMHYIKHVTLQFHTPFVNLCIENDFEKLRQPTETFDINPHLYIGGDNEDSGDLLNGLMCCILYGSWECFDLLNIKYPEFLKYIMNYTGIGLAYKETTLKSKEDLYLYIKQCCNRDLHKLPNFKDLVLMKCFEVDDYDTIQQLKYPISAHILSPYFVYCDDERFLSLLSPVIRVVNSDTLLNLFGNKHLQKKIKGFIV